MTDPTPPAVECVGLSKIFKDFWLRARVAAVSDLDLRIEREQVFGLLGPNGSGKSTTIKLILGLLFPTRGRLQVLGRAPGDVATKMRIGYLPEDSYLYRFLNARELLDYYARLFGLDRKERGKRIDMLLEMVGMEAVGHRPIGEYSKGMQRRLGLAQALINDPELLILDEPTTGMDPIGTRQIKDLIRTLRDRGKTILLCSHLLAEVQDVCDHVAMLYGGRKRIEGSLDELLTQQERTVIETDRLSAEALGRVEAAIQGESVAIHRAEAPRQNLEQLFLDIVAQARSEGATTAGAQAGGPVAAFLAGDAAAQPPAPEAPEDVVASLVEAEVAPAPTRAAPEPAAPAEPEVDRAEIDALTAPEAPAKPQPGPARKPDEPAEPKPEEQVDRAVIDELLDG